MEDLSGIRKRLKERREELGYSYQTLANLTGMSKSTLQRYETGAIGNLPLDKLDTLAKALNCSAAYLMGWESHEDASTVKTPITDDDIKFALFGGGPVTDEQYEEVKRFVQFVKERNIRPKE